MDEIVKFWDIQNIERNMGNSTEQSLNNVLYFLKLKEFLKENSIESLDFQMFKDIAPKFYRTQFREDLDRLYSLYERFSELSNRDILCYVNLLIKNDRYYAGATIPKALAENMFENVVKGAENILIGEPDKFGIELYDFIKNSRAKFYFAMINKSHIELFTILYKDLNVGFLEKNIYDYNFTNKKFDTILCFPLMGGRWLINNEKMDFISREPSFIATQNLLYHLSIDGKLIIILPAKIGFGGGDAETLRNYIQYNYKINEIASLPAKMFYPYTALNTYMLSFSNGYTEDVCVKKYDLEDQRLIEKDCRLIFSDELETMNVWNVDMVFSFTDESIIEYKSSTVKKSPLFQVADVFRGKSITDKVDNGNINVINISNITDIGIDYDHLDSILEEERKVSRYILQDGDVLVATKGFTIKVAVFEKQNKTCIASSNLCVIRPNPRILNGTYLKLFFESDVGVMLLKSLQRGTSIVNINFQDICQIEVPTPPLDYQCEITNEYNEGLKLYKETINSANEAWSKVKNIVKQKLY